MGHVVEADRMRDTNWRMLVLVCGFLVTAVPIVAHHSHASEHDLGKTIEVTGVLKRVDWVNPHTMFHIEVTKPDGSKTMWLWQTGAAGALRYHKEFWGKKVVGGTFTVSGFPARNGKPAGFIKTLTMPDGQVVTFGVVYFAP